MALVVKHNKEVNIMGPPGLKAPPCKIMPASLNGSWDFKKMIFDVK